MDENGELDTSLMNSDERAGWNELMEVIRMENQSPQWNIAPISPAPQMNDLVHASSSSTTSIIQKTTQNVMPNPTSKPFLRIVEQPATKALRFRYECEGRSAGSIPGVSSTPEHRTFPSIEIVNYDKKAIVIVSCVTKDPPYRPHPHKVVGRDGGGQKFENGYCEVTLDGPPLSAVFNNLGIQCVKRREVITSLNLRKSKNINPFKVPYPSNDQKPTYDLNVVRLCFQGFINPTGKQWEALKPEISEPVIDKKGVFELRICQLCKCSGKVNGGDRIILLCEKVDKNDIKIKFSEINDEGEIKWAAYGEFQQSNIHKQYAIVFKTPRYERTDITEAVKVHIQLERPSDGGLSEPLEFEYYPDPGMRTFTRIRRKIKRKEELEIFQQVLSLDSETTATKYSRPSIDLGTCNVDNESVSSDSSASKPNSTDTIDEYDAYIGRRMNNEIDANIDTGEQELDIIRTRDMEIEFDVPQIKYPVADDGTQTSTPMNEILKHPSLLSDETRPLTAIDKITEWMRSSEFERNDSLNVEDGDSNSLSPVTVYKNISYSSNKQISLSTDEDKTYNDLMEQVDDLDNKIAIAQAQRGTLENPILKELSMEHEDDDDAIRPTASTNPSVDLDENFDETATYTSLKIALKNPITIPREKIDPLRKSSQSSSTTAITEEDISGLVVLTNPPAPKIQVNTTLTPPSPPLPVPPRTPSPVLDPRPPPLPPKRHVSNEFDDSKISSPNSLAIRTRNENLSVRPQSQIIIMRTPDHSPTKRQPSPTASSNSTPKKKQGFFSRLFSRKSKSNAKFDQAPETPTIVNDSKSDTPCMSVSRESSVGNFSLADPNRASMRSAKSLQPNSVGLSPYSSNNTSIRSAGGKPVVRSSSSTSGKRPAYLNADVIHIPLKGDESEQSTRATISTFGRQLDRKTLSALQLADIPVCDGNMELIAIADRQSIRNLCEGDFGVILDPDVDLGEAEHFALYTSVEPQSEMEDEGGPARNSECELNDGNRNMTSSPLLTADEIAMRLAQANGLD